LKVRLGNGLFPLYILVIVLITAITLSFSDPLRIVLGILLVIFAPGYVLIAALFPKKDPLDGIERVALSLATSIVVVALLALLLNYTPLGIRLYPVLISLTVFIVAVSIFAWYRWLRLAEIDRFSVSFNLSLPVWGAQSLLRKSLLIILMVVILAVVGVVGYVVSSPRVGERFTEFYLLGLKGEAKDYPAELKEGDVGRVTLVIVNREHETVSYGVEVTIDGIRSSVIQPVVLEQGETWQRDVSFTPVKGVGKQKVEFILYRNQESEPYLKPLYLWINVVE
jgi:uncharacterized membrane protein